MKILLLFPECPDSYWSYKHALRFISKKAAVPPLGLITVSAMLPSTWHKRLVDMNVTPLSTTDIAWADYVFISAMDIQKAGLQVSGGFIVGFDSDTPSVFQRQIDFIQQSGIVSAMVGLLNAPRNTRLYKQLEAENRLVTQTTGNNCDFSINFIPKMNYHELMEGYKEIIHNIYSTRPYYKRIRQLLLNHNRLYRKQTRLNFSLLRAFLKSVFIIGLLNKGRRDYWKLILWTLFNRPGSMVDAITYTVYGYHYQTVYGLRDKKM